jgi:hypothetical protein
MVAPFWADVDTREGLGQVWVKKLYPSRKVYLAAWNSVGYYDTKGDKRNTFMVMISDGNDPGMGIGKNICFFTKICNGLPVTLLMELMALEEHQQLLVLTRVMVLLSWELAVMVVSDTGEFIDMIILFLIPLF